MRTFGVNLYPDPPAFRPGLWTSFPWQVAFEFWSRGRFVRMQIRARAAAAGRCFSRHPPCFFDRLQPFLFISFYSRPRRPTNRITVRPRVHPGVKGGADGRPHECSLEGHFQGRREHQGAARTSAGGVHRLGARRHLRGGRGEQQREPAHRAACLFAVAPRWT